MSKRWTGAVSVGLSALALGIADVTFAQTGSTPVSLPNPLSGQSSLTGVVTAVSGFLITIAIPLTAIMVLVGGFQMITSAGDPEKYGKGRKTLLWAAIGFAVILLASGVVSIIKGIL